MSVEHVVLFKWKDDAPAETIAQVEADVIALKDQISGIVDLTYGKDFNKVRADGFTHMVVVRFVSKEALASYDAHPDHQKVVALLLPIMDKILVMDMESPRLTPAKEHI
ncbi:Aste57867_19772 [Aphanomyces stellatus]|uniref:Aste57867_19772 protein n=1 Tax=Aphanomyces stellatus TaxID=120398 RepID=A0A485LDC9_9STRA|nr:hypothetical protein As57867_019707 [Aphanomyces stellatus]VFT96470.1 Aste57867_19772 [Aphanomyces stellatus]